MITRHRHALQVERDVEFWLNQGYAVGVLRPDTGDEFFYVYVDLLKRR